MNGVPTLIAIEVWEESSSDYAPVEKPVGADILGKYFVYDADKRAYRRTKRDIPSIVKKAAVKIDREIGGTDAPMPEAKDEPRQVQTSDIEENFEPWKPKIRKSGTGCVFQINDNLWEGSFYPRMPDGKRKKFNVYAKTKEECEEALAKMIAEKKAEIAEMKKKQKTA